MATAGGFAFAVCFPGKSPLIPSNSPLLSQVDETHWTLDCSSICGPQYRTLLSSACLVLTSQSVLPSPNTALSLYVQSPGSEWEYRGAVSNESPSGVFALLWPEELASSAPGSGVVAQIGITIESKEQVEPKALADIDSKLSFAKAVARNVFRYMESYMTDSSSAAAAVLDKWYIRFQHKFKLDPTFLQRSYD